MQQQRLYSRQLLNKKNDMGLNTDIFFIKAIKSNSELMSMLPAGDVYDNIANPDIDMDNVKIPYIIVNNDGGSNDRETKDELYEGYEDTVNVSIRIVARSRNDLSAIETLVRDTILKYTKASEDETKPYDYTFSYSDISHDVNKPAFIRMFYYQCQTNNEILQESEQP